MAWHAPVLSSHRFLTVARIQQIPAFADWGYCHCCQQRTALVCQSCKAPVCRARVCRVAHVNKENAR